MSAGDELDEVCEALGLDPQKTRKVVVVYEVGSAPTACVEQVFPDRLAPIFVSYRLVKMPAERKGARNGKGT